jgi:hypothetical protein
MLTVFVNLNFDHLDLDIDSSKIGWSSSMIGSSNTE